MDKATIAVAVLLSVSQMGLGAGAWRLANAIRGRVDEHDVKLENHDGRLTALEKR